MKDECEQALFEKARSGCCSAFGPLQQRLFVPMRGFLRRLIGQHSAEEDILSDAFLALYLNLERISTIENLRPFLYRVLRNLCYTELRKQGRFNTISLETGGEAGDSAGRNLPENRPSTHEQVLWTLLYSEVQKAVDRLPELQRQTLLLYFEEDLTYIQIAEAMSTDFGTVKSRIYYARQSLLRHLRPETADALGIHKEKN